jgi:hypothetical protein
MLQVYARAESVYVSVLYTEVVVYVNMDEKSMYVKNVTVLAYASMVVEKHSVKNAVEVVYVNIINHVLIVSIALIKYVNMVKLNIIVGYVNH